MRYKFYFHPIAWLMFLSAGTMVLLGIVAGVEHKLLQIIVVSLDVFAGLLAHWYYGERK